jgi:beta-1,4-mannosyltransferase
MGVTIFSAFNTILNPYILLFKEALENQGIKVQFERNFNLKWLLSRGKSCDCIHLHWLNPFHTPQKRNGGSQLYNKLMDNRLVKAFLDFLTLIDFMIAFLIAKLAGKIIVFTVHDLYDFGKKSLRIKFQIEIARIIIFGFANSIHAHNNYTRELIERRYKRKQGIFIIPHGNYIGYYPNEISQKEARKRLGLSGKAFVYLFLGLLRPYKGLEDLFDAFKKLEQPEVRLLVAGRVFGIDGYESKLRESSKTDCRINLIPEFIPDETIQVYLKASNFFVLPYKDITTSGAVALAFSFGRPVIAPSIASFPDVVTPASGILYDPSQPNALVSALQEARTFSYLESDIFNYADEFSWNKLGSELASLYKKPV